MNTRRVGDRNEPRVFRSDRFFSSNGKWYFTTREARMMGPYDRKPLAEQALAEYIAEKTGTRLPGWSAPGATH